MFLLGQKIAHSQNPFWGGKYTVNTQEFLPAILNGFNSGNSFDLLSIPIASVSSILFLVEPVGHNPTHTVSPEETKSVPRVNSEFGPWFLRPSDTSLNMLASLKKKPEVSITIYKYFIGLKF